MRHFPNFRAVATTLRHAKTATVNDWGAVCYYEGGFHEARPMPDLEIFDRVGGGDSFASGLIYGFLMEKGADWAVNCGCAHGSSGHDDSRATRRWRRWTRCCGL